MGAASAVVAARRRSAQTIRFMRRGLWRRVGIAGVELVPTFPNLFWRFSRCVTLDRFIECSFKRLQRAEDIISPLNHIGANRAVKVRIGFVDGGVLYLPE